MSVAARQKQTQDRNLERLLTMQVGRPDYDAQRGSFSAFAGLPGLRLFVPCTAFDSTGTAQDFSGKSHDMAINGDPDYDYDGLVHYLILDGTGDYLSVADHADLNPLGTESYIAASKLGMSLAIWVYITGAAGAVEYIIGKDNAGGAVRDYFLRRDAAGDIMGGIWNAAGAFVSDTGGAISLNTWHFCGMSFEPAAAINTYLDGVFSSTPTALVDVRNSAAAFAIGSNGVGGNYLPAYVRDGALVAEYLNKAWFDTYFQNTRAMFGV